MTRRFQFKGHTAVVTGAANGIGAALATGLAKRGCHLALMDVNAEGLQTVAEKLRSDHCRVTTSAFDIGDRDAIHRFADEVEQVQAGVDLLFNNAGVATMGTFDQITEENFDWLLNINLQGPIRMTRAFLPMLRRSADAHITNISSIFGIIAPPGQTAYSASKFGLLGFSDSLRHELAGSTIGVTIVHPGGIDTNIVASSRAPQETTDDEVRRVRKKVQNILVMPPEKAAEIILRGVERRRPRLVVGGDAKLTAVLQRLLPSRYWWWIQRMRDTRAMEFR